MKSVGPRTLPWGTPLVTDYTSSFLERMSKQGNVRGVIELFCKIMQENKVCHIRAETLRQGKFNNPHATTQLWKILLNIIEYCDNNKGKIAEPKESLNDEVSTKDIITVKRRLQSWGYLNPALSQLPSDASQGSRQLLLALGWLVASQRLIDQILHRQSDPLKQELWAFLASLKPPSCGLTKSKSSTHQQTQSERAQLQLLQCGRLRLALRRMYAAQRELANITQDVHRHTAGDRLQSDLSHLSVLEVYLLRHPAALQQMMEEVDRDNERLKRLLQWKDEQHLFWQWLGSVLDLSLKEGEEKSEPQEEEVFLHLPPTIGQDIEVARTKLRQEILKHEANIERMEEILQRKAAKSSTVEKEVATMLSERAANVFNTRVEKCATPRGMSAGVSALIAQDHERMKVPQDEISTQAPKNKFLLTSNRSVQAHRKSDLRISLNNEISKLRDTVDKLKQDLEHRQRQNLEEMQTVICENPDFICILPRHFKHILNT